MIDGLEAHDPLTRLQSVRHCRQAVLDAGLEMPPWQELADSPPPRQEEPTEPQVGWRRSFCGRRCGLASVTVPGHRCVPNTELWFLRH